MSEPTEPEGELTPLPEEPESRKTKLSRSPYIALGVAALVVSTVFATVAALASTREEQAAPAPQSEDTVQTTSPDTYTTEPISTSVPSSTVKKPSKKKPTGGTTEDKASEDEGTTTDGTPTGGDPTTKPGGTTTRPTTSTPPPNKPPVANIGGGCPTTGRTCSFDGSGSSDPDGRITAYKWDFGDGKTASSETAEHTYDSTGDFTVKLTVTDNKGLKTTTSLTVTVKDPPPPSGS
jgi:PKD repeat protein